MLNNKTQKDKVREILKKNKGLAVKNKSLVEEDYKEYKKTKKKVNKIFNNNPENRTVYAYNGIEEFLQEAYTHFLAEAKEMIEKENQENKPENTSEKVSKSKEAKIKPTNLKNIAKNTKTTSTVNEDKSPSKTSNSKPIEDIEPKVVNTNTQDLEKSTYSVKNTLKHPSSTTEESCKELKNPFKEVERNDGNMQLGFFSQQSEKPAKKRSKTNKKKNQSVQSSDLQISFLA